MTSTSLAPGSPISVSPSVAAAIADSEPVVALESTVYSTLGLPATQQGGVRQLASGDS